MNAILYSNKTDGNVLNKDTFKLEDGEIPCTFKDDTEMVDPTLIFTPSPAVNKCDYIWVGEPYNRYYFVKNRELSAGRVYVTCHVDVLMSFKESINNIEVIASRSSSKFDIYQIDTKMPVENFHDITTVEFPTGFGSDEWILAVTGKVGGTS